MKEDNSEIEATMKSASVINFCPKFGEITDEIITFSPSSQEKPCLLPNKKPSMIVKVLSCSIAAGDTMILSGNIIFLKPSLPYVPGMDICGRVEEVSEGVEFKVGDIIVASNGMFPVGGMAEYMLVNPSLATLKPSSVDIHEAASCTSAITSFNAVKYIKEDDRVLILGGSGGVGSSSITLSKLRGASYVATTSTYQRDILLGLGADEVINYEETNWWDVEEYQKNKFDVIIDTVGGGNFYDKATLVLKTGEESGYFVAVTGDDPRVDISSWYKAVKYIGNMPSRYVYTWFYKKHYPQYILLLPVDEVIGLVEVLKLMEEKKLKILIDPSSPHSFTKEGVQEAFRIQGSGHAHGKVLVKVSD